jgi:hypothetical protein
MGNKKIPNPIKIFVIDMLDKLDKPNFARSSIFNSIHLLFTISH